MNKQSVLLVHWKREEAAEREKQLENAGFHAVPGPSDGSQLKQIKFQSLNAVVIDLTRLPSHGREVAVWLRRNKSSRHLPLIFVEGDVAKVEKIKSLLPDASFTTWNMIDKAVRNALAKPAKDPVVPESNLAGYSGTPLVKKLGIKENFVVHLINAPAGIETILGDLPKGTAIGRNVRGKADLLIWFTTSKKDLVNRIDKIKPRIGQGGLWIAWPKKASAMATELTQADVRNTGLNAGLVDYKICAIDETWSGLKFSIRR